MEAQSPNHQPESKDGYYFYNLMTFKGNTDLDRQTLLISFQDTRQRQRRLIALTLLMNT